VLLRPTFVRRIVGTLPTRLGSATAFASAESNPQGFSAEGGAPNRLMIALHLLLLPAATTLMQAAPPARPIRPTQPVVTKPDAAQQTDTPLPLTPGLPEAPGALPPSPDASSLRIITLEEAQRSAVQNQPQIHQARAATAASVGRVWEARSGYLPQVVGTALLEYTNSSSSTGTSTTGGSSSTTTTTTTPTATSAPYHGLFYAGLNATQLIYDFGQTSEKWRAANRATESLEATEKATINQVLLTVRSAFFTARADKALVKVAEETLANELKHLAQIAGQVGVGVSAEIDLATEKTTVANDRLALIQAQNSYDIARVQLSVAMGVGSSTAYDVADESLPVIDGENDTTDHLVGQAIANRPELLSLKKEQEYNELTVRSLQGGFGPTLSAIGGLSVVDAFDLPAADAAAEGLYPSAYVGLSLTWPLFQGGLTVGQVKEAKGNLGVTEAQLEQELLQVRLDVEQARLGVRTYKVAITTADELVTNARYQLRLAEKRYAAGVGSIIELGDAQVAVTSASTQRVQADFNLATARAQLLTALGRQ
jgi:outer membrane protein